MEELRNGTRLEVDHDSDGGGGARLDAKNSVTPAVVAVVALLIVAFLMVSYYRVFWIARRNRNPVISSSAAAAATGYEDSEAMRMRRRMVMTVSSSVAQSGLPASLIDAIPVVSYRDIVKEKKAKAIDDGYEDGECVVCLAEFVEEEQVKVLPRCNHWFHVRCIDAWLSTHSNCCPLCRLKVELASVDHARDHESVGGSVLIRIESQQEEDGRPQQLEAAKSLRSSSSSWWRLRKSSSTNSVNCDHNTSVSISQQRTTLGLTIREPNSSSSISSSSSSSAVALQASIAEDPSGEVEAGVVLKMKRSLSCIWRHKKEAATSHATSDEV